MQGIPVMDDNADVLAGKVVLIAGSCQEVSEATARLFAQRGAEGLLIGGRGLEGGQATAAIISAAGCPTQFLPADFTKLEDGAALVARADQLFGRLDLVIFSAGMVAARSSQKSMPEQFDHIVQANLRAPFFLMLDAARLMQREAMAGTIVTVLGVPGEGDPLSVAAYEASQGGLAAMTRSFAAGLVDYQIRVLGLDLGGCDVLREGDPGALLAGPFEPPPLRPLAVAGALARLVADPDDPPAGTIVPLDQVPLAMLSGAPRPRI